MTNLTFYPGDVNSSTPNKLQVAAGRASFFLVNPNESSAEHNMSIKDSAGNLLAQSIHVPVGSAGTFVIDSLPAGHYTMYCEVGSHASEGMVGDLTAN
jgi:uncharacterized cupredoxin-like copper-binding protein